MSDRHVPARTAFQKSVRDLLESHPQIDILGVAARVEVPFRPGEDQRENPAYPTEAILRALYAREVAGWRNPELAQRLEDRPELSSQLGFDRDTPDQSSFWRYWNSGLIADELKASIQRKARWTRKKALAMNHPIGDSALIPKETEGKSARTESRLIREKLESVPREMVNLVADEWNYLPPRASNTRYHRNDFLELECLMGVKQLAAEGGAEIYGDSIATGDQGPDGDTHLHYIKECTPEGILRRTHNATGLMVNRAKEYLSFDRPVDVAIDYTDVPYYGQDRDGEWVLGRKGFERKDYDWAHRYASISVVGDNVPFVLGFIPVPIGLGPGEVVDRLLDAAQLHVRVDTVYADAEFAASNVVRSFDEHAVDYVVPVPHNTRIKREIRRMTEDVEVKREYGFYGKQPGRGTKERAETNLVLVPSRRSDGDVAAFYTNKDVSDDRLAARNRAERVVNRYRRRWGIETQYRSLKTFLPWTTSNDRVVRLFHFAFGMLLYNLWRLIDFLIQESLTGYETRRKPRVKAKRFITAVQSADLLV